MTTQWSKGLLAGGLILTLALPGWAAEEKKAAPAKEVAKEMKREKRATAKGSEDTKKVQEALKAKGHDPGPIDGIMGPKTRAAVKVFQKASGLKETGRLDDQTAEKLGVEKPKTPAKKAEVKKEEKK